MIAPLQVPVIGFMQSPFKEKFGIPRQPNLVDVESYIVMQAAYDDPLAFVGIEEFSHLWLLWQFHHNKRLMAFDHKFARQDWVVTKKLGCSLRVVCIDLHPLVYPLYVLNALNRLMVNYVCMCRVLICSMEPQLWTLSLYCLFRCDC